VKPNATFLAKYMTHAVVSVSSNVDGGCCGCEWKKFNIKIYPWITLHIIAFQVLIYLNLHDSIDFIKGLKITQSVF
jgi:hypothetical protein